jgi:hypothetical protein
MPGFNQLREPAAPYMDLLGAKKNDVGPENTYFWGNSD